jgi:hypothetical protein
MGDIHHLHRLLDRRASPEVFYFLNVALQDLAKKLVISDRHAIQAISYLEIQNQTKNQIENHPHKSSNGESCIKVSVTNR